MCPIAHVGCSWLDGYPVGRQVILLVPLHMTLPLGCWYKSELIFHVFLYMYNTVQGKEEGDDKCLIHALAFPLMRKNNPPYKLVCLGYSYSLDLLLLIVYLLLFIICYLTWCVPDKIYSLILKSVLKDHCHVETVCLAKQIFLAECNWTCHQRSTVFKD